MHPRLFTSLVLIEPVIVPDTFSGHGPMLSLLSLKRRDTWPSKSAAVGAARKAYKRWDSRVFERWTRSGYQELPTVLYPQSETYPIPATNMDDPPVTLASSKYQEVMQYIRPNFDGHTPLGQEGIDPWPSHDPLMQPDIIGPSNKISPFYKSEAVIAWKMLDHVRPSVLYGNAARYKPRRFGLRCYVERGVG